MCFFLKATVRNLCSLRMNMRSEGARLTGGELGRAVTAGPDQGPPSQSPKTGRPSSMVRAGYLICNRGLSNVIVIIISTRVSCQKRQDTSNVIRVLKCMAAACLQTHLAGTACNNSK